MLEIKRTQIEKFLRQKKVSYRTDETNLQTKYLRNKIRLKLLPLLRKDYNPKIKETLNSFAQIISTDYDFLYTYCHNIYQKEARYAKGSISFSLKNFNQYHLAIQRLLLRIAIDQLKGDTRSLTLKHLQNFDDALKTNPKTVEVHLPANIILKIRNNVVIVGKN